MKILVIDGQGGRMGSLFIDRFLHKNLKNTQVTAVGTNSTATASMLKAGAKAAATGENSVRVNAKDADYIVGPIGIMAADALLGEVTKEMANAVASSSARKILIPVSTCQFHVVGVGDYSMGELIDLAVEEIAAECSDTVF